MHHRHDGFIAFKFVPLIADHSELVLAGGERSDVPRDVVAPSDRLHPVNTAK